VTTTTAEPKREIRRINAGKGHWYRVDGRKCDGVTTLIKNGRPNPALIGWAARETAEYVADNLDIVNALAETGRAPLVGALSKIHTAVLQNAANRGTRVHAVAEALAKDLEVEYDDDIAGHVEAYVMFLDQWQVKPLLVEAVIASRTFGFAGTVDLVADVVTPGDIGLDIAPWLSAPIPAGTRLRGIFDPKTSRSGVWPDAAYQLAAYRYSDVYLDSVGLEQPTAALGIEHGFVVHVRSDGYDVHPMDAGPRTFEDFQYIATAARRIADDNKRLVGGCVIPKESF
jgi:hypothetical protein